jgi:hypothetical protein
MGRAGGGHLPLACDDHEPARLQNLCPQSSRICPANDRATSRNDGNGWSIESAGQEPDSPIPAGSEIGLENTLKVETRVANPRWDCKRKNPKSATSPGSVRSLNRHSNAGDRANIPRRLVPEGVQLRIVLDIDVCEYLWMRVNHDVERSD